MVPVSLRLKNFMSYGADAPVLDFELFQVACLSGRNGQGKSALLDAVTWSLWGEARKSAGTQKPDDELLRSGTREMQVEFVFDIDGERYRVIRTYSRSATGKTNKSQLELHLLEAAQDDFRPLTGTSIKETQQAIERVLGIDYNTFINSAFLLQGRSDEFTKKRPGERKEILTRILNLSRYDALYDLAAEHERDARKAEEQALLDVERLQKALEEEAEWKTRHEAVSADIDAAQARLASLRAEEKCLTERLADLDAQARAADTLRTDIEALGARLEQHQQDAADLREKIARAEALIAQHDAIQKDHERLLALQQERDALDAKNELFRGIEKQLERRQAELKDKKNALEGELYRLNLEAQTLAQRVAAAEAELAERPSVERRLEQAATARRQAEAMSAVYEERTGLEGEIRGLEQTLARRREALQAQHDTLEAHYQGALRAQPDLAHLAAEEARLTQAVARYQELKEELQATADKGKDIAADLHQQTGILSAKKEELGQLEETLEHLGAEAEGHCPTCGTALTPEHRQQVRAEYAERIAGVTREVYRLETVVAQRKQAREVLLTQYKDIKAEQDELAEAPEHLARVQEQRKRAEEAQKTLEKQAADLEQLRETLASGAYGEEETRRLADRRRRLDALDFDAERYAQLRDEAAQAEQLQERLRRLAEAAGLKDQLAATLARKEQEAARLRATLDDGSAFGPVQAMIDQLTAQRDGVGFDAVRFREVKQQLEDLAEAGTRMTELAHAQHNHAEWKTRLADVETRAAQAQESRTAQAARLAEIEAELAGRDDLEAKRRAQAEACQEAETALHGLQMNLGQLREKLLQAERDRAALRQRRTDSADAKRRRGLY